MGGVWRSGRAAVRPAAHFCVTVRGDGHVVDALAPRSPVVAVENHRSCNPDFVKRDRSVGDASPTDLPLTRKGF